MNESTEGWEDIPRLFNVRSNESLRPLSIASGKSVGSTGSGRGLGGESIWTLKEDEGAKWPSAPPSSGGHSMGARNPNQWTLQSLIDDSLSQIHSYEARGLHHEQLFPDEHTEYSDFSRHPYQ
jgi:hypothetical protein